MSIDLTIYTQHILRGKIVSTLKRRHFTYHVLLWDQYRAYWVIRNGPQYSFDSSRVNVCFEGRRVWIRDQYGFGTEYLGGRDDDIVEARLRGLI